MAGGKEAEGEGMRECVRREVEGVAYDSVAILCQEKQHGTPSKISKD